MTTAIREHTALVVLPPIGAGRVRDQRLRKWLGRSAVRRDPVQGELLRRVTAVIGSTYPDEGLAALRMWGQTGDRPTVWIAGADPVYLEPRLDHLCLHSLRKTGIPSTDLRPLYDHLQDVLSVGTEFGFTRLGTCGYLRADQGMATADVPTYIVHDDKPDDYLPTGEGAERYRRLVSEVEMALHDHPVNIERQGNGLQPVNSLWIWGGGHAPDLIGTRLPVLFSDNPLLTGYWESAAAVSSTWPGDLEACFHEAGRGFVAITPNLIDDTAFLEHCLRVLMRALKNRKLAKVVLLSRDGLRIDIARGDAIRFWRGRSPLLETPS